MSKTEEGPPVPVFDGWDTPHFTPIPDQLFDEWLPHLSEAELKVLLYIMRRTFGFKKDADAISLSQMANGIVKADGTRLDWGAGITERSALRALPRLLEKGLLEAHKSQTAAGDAATTVYRLRLRGSRQIVSTPRLDSGTGPDKLSPPVPTQSPPQETVQETVPQEDRLPISTPQEPLPYSAYIAGVLLDHARELGAAPRGSHDLATVLGWWVRSGLGEAAFVERLHAARAETRQRQAPGRDKWLLYLDALRAGLRE